MESRLYHVGPQGLRAYSAVTRCRVTALAREGDTVRLLVAHVRDGRVIEQMTLLSRENARRLVARLLPDILTAAEFAP